MKSRRAREASRSPTAASRKRPGQAEPRLRQLQERYEIVMGAVNESVYDWDISRDRVYFAEGMERRLGLPPGLLKGSFKPWHERIHPEDFARYREATIAHLKGATKRFECDYRYRAQDGTWRWARTHGLAQRDARGRAVRMVGSTGDITELKQAEEALQKSEDRYALATSAAAEGIYEWDLATGRLFLTERAKALFSFPAEELTPGAWNRRIHGEDFAGYRQAIVDHFKGRTTQLEHEYRISDLQGDYRWVLERGIGVRNAEGRVVKMVGALTDITRRKRAELTLQRALDRAEEALEQQTATAEILRVMSGSPADVLPVFEAILTHASRLCEASFAAVFLYDGETLTNVARRNASPEFARFLERLRVRPSRETTTRRCALERRTIHTADLLNDPEFSPPEAQRRENVRTALSVPMMREGTLVGVITLWRGEVRPFTDKQIALVETFADQAVIAIENVRLFNETRQALEQQTAIAEVQRVISKLQTDVQPVLDAIAANALKLCEAKFSVIFRFDGELIHLAALHNVSPTGADAIRQSFPMPPGRGGATPRAILSRAIVHIPDIRQDPEYVLQGLADRAEYRSILSVPMLRDERPVGAITVVRAEPTAFPDKQIALLKTFADQAVIAIENVRLFNETREALEQQAAIAEVLDVVTQLQTDVQPVFEAIGRNAARLCGALFSCVYRFDGELIHLAATHNLPPAAMQVGRSLYPMRPDRSQLSGRAVLTRSVQRLEDAAQDADYAVHVAVAGGWRRLLAVPMLREAEPLGVIAVGWRDPGPIPEPRVELLKTFADQAVIAIEKVRLFNETREALEQQKASGEVLQAISSSIADTAPVFDKILESCERLFAGRIVGLNLLGEDNLMHIGAYHGPHRERFERIFPVPPGRSIVERRVVHYPDTENGEDVPGQTREGCRAIGIRSVIFAPVLWEGRALGSIFVGRDHVSTFSEKETVLLKTFADQAAIAIENARLFNETKEALEQQTAISEVLRVISRSPGEIIPMLDAVAERAVKLCESGEAGIFLLEGDRVRFVAGCETGETFTRGETVPLTRGSVLGRAIIDRQVVHVVDLASAPVEEFALAREYQKRFGHRTLVAVPLMREDRAIGVIGLWRFEVRAFSDNHIALVRTFADQAAIAIENVRLFNETKEALEQQKASGEVLQAISGSIADTAPVFDKILESCQRLFAGTIVGLNLVREDGMLHIGAYQGAHREEFERIFPIPLTPGSGSGLSILERRAVHYPDAEREDVPDRTRRGCRAIGVKSVIFAPVLWEGRGLGAIFVGRDHTSSFSEKEIALLRTFADQAAIAIENVHLFNETREALERQIATAEILRVISSSPTDTKPVFDAIVQGGLRLFADAAISVALPDGEQVRAAAVAESDSSRAAAWRGRFPFPLTREYMHGVAILDRKVVDIPDVRDAPPAMAAGARNFLASGYRGITIMPMMRGEEAIGALSVVRVAPGPLTDRQLAVLKTFADQAVIAIENVRLFNEIREKSTQLEIASRHKSEFLANMSHELRTPLNAIIGFTRIVMRRSREALEPKQYENLERILTSSEQLLALINSILDLSKVEAGRVELHPGEVGLAPVLEQCMRTVEPLAKVTLLKEFDGELPRMYVDEEKLRQIVINLLSNAVKFTQRGAIRVKAQAANGSVAIAVCDTGIGIAPDKLELIFQEFEQADTSSTRIYGGTGLGLAIARRLARLMGGDITAESVLGSGSTFRLTLPVRYGPAA